MQQLKGISQLIQSSTAMQPTSMFPTGRCRLRLSPVKKSSPAMRPFVQFSDVCVKRKKADRVLR